MARTGVGYIDIAKAAETLKQRGEEPTVDRVRAELGTGSKSTIAPLLKRWRTEVEGDVVDPGGLPRELVEALKSLYERVQSTAEAEIQKIREESEAAQANLERELANTRSALSARTAELEDLEQKLRASEEEGVRLQSTLDHTRAALEKSEFQREEGNARIAELKSSIGELKAENRDVREHFEHFQQRTAEDRQQERDQARLVAEQLRTQVAGLSEQSAQASRKLAELGTQLEEARRDQRELEADRQTLAQNESAGRAQIAALEGRVSELLQQLSENALASARIDEELSSLRVREATAVREIDVQQAMTARLEADLLSYKTNVESLREENRLILQEKAILQGRFSQLEHSLKNEIAD